MAVENVGIGDRCSWATGLWTYAKQPQGQSNESADLSQHIKSGQFRQGFLNSGIVGRLVRSG
jgi:hypothetical protein